MKRKESYGPQGSPLKIFIYIVIVVLLLGGIAYLVKCTRARQAAFQEQIRELGAQETEFVQRKQTVITEDATEAEENNESTEKPPSAAARNDKNKISADAASEVSSEIETETGTETETESESGSEDREEEDNTAVKKQHILLLNGSGKDGMAARWQKKLEKAGYTNVTVASFPGHSIEQTRIYVEREEEEAELEDLKEQFSGAEVTTAPFTAEITLEDGSAPKDVELYIIIGKNDTNDTAE